MDSNQELRHIHEAQEPQDSPEAESEARTSVALSLQETYPRAKRDERGFVLHLPPLSQYEQRIAEALKQEGSSRTVRTALQPQLVARLWDMIKATGRVPSPAELRREGERQEILGSYEHTWTPWANIREVRGQVEVCLDRAKDFPDLAVHPDAWIDAPAWIEVDAKTGRRRLFIRTPNQKNDGDGYTNHPVMTTEEEKWVDDSADVIANNVGPKGSVFTAGLGLGLLTKKLADRGVSHQVVAEINKNVMKIVGEPLQAEVGEKRLDIRQGDWRKVLQEAIKNGERFDAVSIDAFPNSAEEVNRDASSKEALLLGFEALKPGGMLTFYPDSHYLPARVLKVLREAGIPGTCIHYTVSEFDVSDFTQEYHYGKHMAVPCIRKPVITDLDTVQEMARDYEERVEPAAFARYLEQYPDERRQAA